MEGWGSKERVTYGNRKETHKRKRIYFRAFAFIYVLVRKIIHFTPPSHA